MSLLKKAMQEARSEEEDAVAQAVATLSEDPQEAAQVDHFSVDPLTGYDAAQIALRLFDGRRLEEFSSFLKEKNLSPNIVLPNGLTLLQNSIFRYPHDNGRVECLLSLGANPNLFMRRIEEEGFGNCTHRATYHPLNYAFANCPETTTPEVCRILRKYGASADGVRNYFEVDPSIAVPDDETKAKLRRELITTTPDPELTKLVRKDVDLSIMQKHMANVETQLAVAGFQVVSYVPPKKAKARIITPDNMIPLFENFRVLSDNDFKNIYISSKDSYGLVKDIMGYNGSKSIPNLSEYVVGGEVKLKLYLGLDLTSLDPLDMFGWLPAGASVGISQQNQALASLKPNKIVVINLIGQKGFASVIVGLYKDKKDNQFFYDPSFNGIRFLSKDDKEISLTKRNDIVDGLNASFNYIVIKEPATPSNSPLEIEKESVLINTGDRPHVSVSVAAPVHPGP